MDSGSTPVYAVVRTRHGNTYMTTLAFGVEPDKRPYRLRLARYHALAETITDFVRQQPEDRPLALLDAGAGNGRTYRYLEPFNVVDRIRFHGLDNSQHRLTHLYKADRWAELRLHDLEEGIPYPDESFDIVVCEQVLEHLNRAPFVLSELHRVLRPGGMLIAGVPSFPPGIAHLRATVVPLIDRLRSVERGHVQVFTAGSFRRMVCQAGNVASIQTRGFRIVSGGVLRFLENYEWWYRVNRTLGRWAAPLCVEVQVVAIKAGDPAGRAPAHTNTAIECCHDECS